MGSFKTGLWIVLLLLWTLPAFANPPSKPCSIHHVAMTPVEVGISYGLPYYDVKGSKKRKWEKYRQARDEFFPQASKKYVLGGCIVDEKKKTMKIHVCFECTKAEETWRKKNKNWTDYPPL